MIIISSTFYIYIISLIFFTGVLGAFIAKKNLILFLLSMEVIFLASNLMFVVGSFYADDVVGIGFIYFLLAVAANEVAIGLALIIVYTKRHNNNLFFLNFLKG